MVDSHQGAAMDTAICTFDNTAAAEQARDRLLAAGFARHDLHIVNSGHPADVTRGEDLRHRGGAEHEIALSTDVVERVTGFFGMLFGRKHPHTDTYAGHVEGGRSVLLLDAHAPGDVQRARTVLEGERAAHYDVVDRTGGKPMRDLLASDIPVHVESSEAVQASFHGRSTDWTSRGADRPTAGRDVHATATGDGDLDNVNLQTEGIQRSDKPAATQGEGMDPIGLRYADKGDSDKPVLPRDGLGRTRKDD
jgi:hypothetical protein